jgi:integrase
LCWFDAFWFHVGIGVYELELSRNPGPNTRRPIPGKATINSSRTFGEDNSTKTEASTRTITLLPNVIEVLQTLQPLHIDAENYVFTDEQGKPVDQNGFGRKFTGVSRVLNIRPRRFYNTRHTSISVTLTIGCNQKWIAEQTF